MIHAINLYRHEVWIFVLNGAYRRVILTEFDKVEEVNSAGEPITEASNSKPEPIQEAPKISLQEVLFLAFSLFVIQSKGVLERHFGA